MSASDWTAEQIGAAAVRALLYELSATPKPGLVDRSNSGAHRDMNFFTFLDSAAALSPYFTAVAQAGMERCGEPPEALFGAIRPLGVEAERTMLAATGGVNTHKGAVFTLGILCAAAGHFAACGSVLEPEALCRFGGAMTAGLCAREYAHLEQKQVLTKGEHLYLTQGVGGVRAQAEAGFPSLREVAYPVLERTLLESGASVERCLLHTLLHLMAKVDDTNVLGRGGVEAALYVKAQAERLLGMGGALPEENRPALCGLDGELIARNLSPGGSADLLAAAYFLFLLRHPGFKTAG